MALTNKGTKWENKNSLFLVWGFFPILNCVPFFHMNARIENKKYKKLAWASVVINIICIVSIIITMVCTVQITYYDRMGLYDYRDTAPQIENYLGYNYYDKYGSDYNKQPEYYEYEKDYRNWSNSEEIKVASRHAEDVEIKWVYIDVMTIVIYFVFNIIILILAFFERPKYLRELAKVYSASDVFKRMSNVKLGITDKSNEKRKETDLEKDSNEKRIIIDINSASEEELSALQGLTVVDAKKAISYRSENNGFNSIDEFFTCINAKPHIIVTLEKQLIVGEYKFSKTEKADNSGKRMLDL